MSRSKHTVSQAGQLDEPDSQAREAPVLVSRTGVLRIKQPPGRDLTKEQLRFNKLNANLQKRRNEFVRERDKVQRVTLHWRSAMPPLEEALAHAQLQMAWAIARSRERFTYTPLQLERVHELIVLILGEAFNVIEPDEEAVKLYDSIHFRSYKEEVDTQQRIAEDFVASFISEMYGVKIDPADLDGSPESYARIDRQISDRMRAGAAKHGADARQPRSGRRGSGRNQAGMTGPDPDMVRREQEALRLRSMRELYISLVKVLHPDGSLDPAVQAERDDLMKHVTSAYHEKDLAALLALGTEWLSHEGETAPHVADELLQHYNELLQEQIRGIRDEIRSIYELAHVEGLPSNGRGTEAALLRAINEECHELDKTRSTVRRLHAEFTAAQKKKEAMRIIDRMLHDERALDAFHEMLAERAGNNSPW